MGGIYNSTNDTRDASKIEEYRDLDNGVLSNIFVRGRNDRTWIDGYGENFGRDDMYLIAARRKLRPLQVQDLHEWLPHNFLFDGRTPFTGAGSGQLTTTFPQPDPATWNSLNIGYKRKDNGGFFEWQGLAPVVFPRRRQSGRVRRHQDRLGRPATARATASPI